MDTNADLWSEASKSSVMPYKLTQSNWDPNHTSKLQLGIDQLLTAKHTIELLMLDTFGTMWLIPSRVFYSEHWQEKEQKVEKMGLFFIR